MNCIDERQDRPKQINKKAKSALPSSAKAYEKNKEINIHLLKISILVFLIQFWITIKSIIGVKTLKYLSTKTDGASDKFPLCLKPIP